MSDTPGPSHTGLSWPIVTIDFEASSLEQDGYPIEVGLAVWFSLDQPMLGWSTLIRPIRDWTSNGHWSVASAKVHGIRGGDLGAHGREPGVIAAALNEVMGTGTVAWCDGGPYDAHWMAALFKAGKLKPTFTLGDWDRLVGRLDQAGRERAWTWLERAPSRHRARQDAEALLLALMEGIGVEPRSEGDLADHLPALQRLQSSSQPSGDGPPAKT